MIARRNLLTLLGAGMGTSALGLSQSESHRREDIPSRDRQRAIPDPCRDTFADPPWKQLSSAKGDLPVPRTSDQQTGSMVGDIDADGRIDFVITNRRHANAAIWMQNTAQGWKQHVIDPGPLNIEAGGALFDVDGDGHLDLVAGGDSSTNEVWWWQNPHP